MCAGDESGVELVQAGLAALNAADVVELSDERVRAEVLALLACANQLSAALAMRIGSFDARDLAQTDALRTTRTWLTGFGRMSQGAASGHPSRARLLRAAAYPPSAESDPTSASSSPHLPCSAPPPRTTATLLTARRLAPTTPPATPTALAVATATALATAAPAKARMQTATVAATMTALHLAGRAQRLRRPRRRMQARVTVIR
jgi:hypothetical protein